jgi:L-ascorbate metabolism protein UlaG (beta-lactamase superfamily)
LQITYIANEGFFISCDNKKILLDALFKTKNYTSPSDSLVANIINSIPPVDNIDFLLVTHNHRDHFDIKLTSEFLSKNTKTKFISYSESCKELNEIGFNSSQLNCYNLELGELKEINEINDEQISITALRLKHGTSSQINNLAFMVRFNNCSIMHMGDAFILQSEEYLKKINWNNYKIDVLFMSYLDINEYVLETLKNTIMPKNIIMMHIHEEDIPEAIEQNKQHNAKAIIFEKELETKIFNK